MWARLLAGIQVSPSGNQPRRAGRKRMVRDKEEDLKPSGATVNRLPAEPAMAANCVADRIRLKFDRRAAPLCGMFEFISSEGTPNA